MEIRISGAAKIHRGLVRLRVWSLPLVVTLAVAGCGASEEGGSSDGPKVAVLASVGLQDSGLGRATQKAGDLLEDEYGADVTVEGSILSSTWADSLRNYASRDYPLIIVNDIVGNAAALEVGAEFPDTKFVVVNGYAGQEPNVSAVTYEWLEGGHLAGIVSGLLTQSNMVAGMGADKSVKPIELLMQGFEQGVKKVNPDATVQIVWNGIGAGDPIKATQQAKALVGEGADVIYGVANDGNKGLFQAATDAGIFGIGYGVDENNLAPDAVVTSTMVDYVGSIERAYQRFEKGELGSDVTVEGNDLDVWRLADFHGLLDEQQASEVEDAVKSYLEAS